MGTYKMQRLAKLERAYDAAKRPNRELFWERFREHGFSEEEFAAWSDGRRWV